MLKISSHFGVEWHPYHALCLCSLVIFGLACSSGAPVDPPPAAVATPVSQPVVAPPLPVDIHYLLGKFSPDTLSSFVVIRQPYTDKPGMMLRKETFQAFEAMWKAAEKDGVILKIVSSTRTFDQQKKIWEGKWIRFAKEAPVPKTRALKILEFSSMPGSSRHHWGTDIDLNDLNNAAFEKNGKYEIVYTWLQNHAHEFGFCQPYTAGRPQVTMKKNGTGAIPHSARDCSTITRSTSQKRI